MCLIAGCRGRALFRKKPDVEKLYSTARSCFCCLFVPLANSHYSSLIVYIFFSLSCSLIRTPLSIFLFLFLFLSKAIIVISSFLLSFFYLIPELILVLISSLHFLLVLTHPQACFALDGVAFYFLFIPSLILFFFLQKPRVSFFHYSPTFIPSHTITGISLFLFRHSLHFPMSSTFIV